ncbi:hypothetical protein HPU229334_10360 [Helicobacter pullorum]|uniref:HipA-like C-terminal domain-containing protein n=1 Tax=Helicobacter pullorum TaxID=35818 RepID=A0A0N1E7U1_9HELI|nr:HipA domain-containing protein [Helicobacter pullorum]KPH55033.1 hypothetical protein HPU229334_10360 [Helicobacter pullorum]
MYKIKELVALEFSEPLGTKEKYWTKDKKLLFKIGRENTLENCSEKIACEIAKLIGIPTAEYELAKYRNGVEKLGVVSNNFLKEGESLKLINEVLAIATKDYEKEKRYKQTEYTLNKSLEIVKGLQEATEAQDMLCNFVGYLIFDCLIGNQDRHHENWGFIIGNKSIQLAPSFDHASGVASKVSDKEAKERLNTNDKNRSVEAFCKRAKTPFYNEQGEVLKTFEVVNELCKKPQTKQYSLQWIQKISQLTQADYQGILDKIPREFITQNQKDFIKVLLAMNTRLLQEIEK